MAEIIDVVTAVKRGDSIQVTIPARLVKRLGIRKGDRLAVYLTWDDEAKTEAILYVPVRAPGPGPETQAPGVHDEVLPAEASMKKRGQLSKARRADRARSPSGRDQEEPRPVLACDGGEESIVIRVICQLCGRTDLIDLNKPVGPMPRWDWFNLNEFFDRPDMDWEIWICPRCLARFWDEDFGLDTDKLADELRHVLTQELTAKLACDGGR